MRRFYSIDKEKRMKKVTVGLIGCGAISPAYLDNFTTHFRSILEVRACADLFPELAQKRAAAYAIPKVCRAEEIVADPEIELVVNLTFAPEHYALSKAALEAGKHVFSEKPLAVTLDEGRDLVESARRKGVLLAGAADIFLGGGLQTCRQLLDSGAIGTPVLASAFIALNYGNQPRWQKKGTGPVFDMGPYYLTALAALVGPVRRVCGATAVPIPVKSDPEGKSFQVETPMEAAATFEFEAGLLGVFAASGEAAEGYVPRLEFYGSAATLQANDPNMYCRPVLIRGGSAPREVALERGFLSEGRGLGVAEMAWALRTGRQPRASGELMLHVLEVSQAIHRSAESGQRIQIESKPERPAPFDLDEMLSAFAG
jgi:predicted dehydrogenase